MPDARLGAESKRILFFSGPASHGWGSHQHPAGSHLLVAALRKSAVDVEVDLTFDWPSAERLQGADALVIYSDGWNVHPATDHLDDLSDFMDRSGGLTVLHWATGIGGKDLWSKERVVTKEPVRLQWRGLVGADFEPWHSVSVFWDASFQELADHEVTRGVPPFTVWDECYFHLRCSELACDHVTPLHGAHPEANLVKPGARADSGSESALSSVKNGEPQYCSWGFERPEGGRAFGYTGGHLHWNWARDEVRKLVLNGIYWTSGAEVPRDGVVSPRPSAGEMLEHLEGNPGWTEERLQGALDLMTSGTKVRWNAYHRGPLPDFDAPAGLYHEGETLEVLSVGGGQVDPQGMRNFGAGLWSGETQLWWHDGQPGDVLKLSFPVATAGRYQVGVGLAKAVDYGQVEIAVNGQRFSNEPIDCFHASGVVHTGEIVLGQRKLNKGPNTIELRISGANEAAIKRYMVGLDYLRLVSLADEAK